MKGKAWSSSWLFRFSVLISLVRNNAQKYNKKSLKNDFIDDYHFPMVADEIRNNIFYEALKKYIIPNVSNVLDVGAGTMLLSMMSARLGAARVLGVESNPTMLTIAKEVLRVNNFTADYRKKRVSIYEGEFQTLTPAKIQVLLQYVKPIACVFES